MTTHDATEQAFLNGYEKGKRDAVKHGHWVETSCGFECSCCGGSWDEYYHHLDERDFEFCNFCGAIMNEAIE